MQKLLVLILFSVLLTSINTCQFGTFTSTSPCDTTATPIPYKKFTSISIEPDQWAYFYIPLKGIKSNVMLSFKVNGAFPYAYLTIQPANYEELLLPTSYYYSFLVQQGVQEMPPPRRMNGIEDFDDALMLLGLANYDTSEINVQVEYFAERDDDEGSAVKKLVIGIIVAVAMAVFILLCIIGYFKLKVRRLARRNVVAAQNANISDIEAQRILRNNNIADDHLSLEDLQKYFPKKSFKNLENPFQQTGCSVCIEDFTPDISCHQLYCNHIFHEVCAEKWLEKHNNCPDCRVSIGKRAVEEFLQAKRRTMLLK